MSEHEREDDVDEVAWLLARERGQPGPTVSAATPARYAQLQSLIKDLPAMPAGVSPGAGWQRDVLAAIDAADAESQAPSPPSHIEPIGRAAPRATIDAADAEPEAPSPPAPVRIDRVPPERTSTRPRRWAAVTAIFAAAAIVVIVFAVYRDRGGGPDGPVAEPTLASELKPAARPHRSADPSIGDTLIVRGVVEGPGELRVYDDNGVERASCTVPAADCGIERSGTRTTLRLTMPLRVPGVLRGVLFAAPLAGPSGGMDADLEAAMRAGIAVTPRELVEVH